MTTMTIPAAAGSGRATDAQASPAVLRKVLTASFIGNFVEWFDYASYGYFATVIAAVFFPEIAPQAALLATFAVFAISFVIRPIGGIVWGSIGDRIGRKTALSWSTLPARLPGKTTFRCRRSLLLDRRARSTGNLITLPIASPPKTPMLIQTPRTLTQFALRGVVRCPTCLLTTAASVLS